MIDFTASAVSIPDAGRILVSGETVVGKDLPLHRRGHMARILAPLGAADLAQRDAGNCDARRHEVVRKQWQHLRLSGDDAGEKKILSATMKRGMSVSLVAGHALNDSGIQSAPLE